MNFRKLNRQEMLDALHLIWNVYARETAPHRTTEQVKAFQTAIKYENVMQGWGRGELFFLGWYEQEKLIGTAALTPLGKIIFFAVESEEHYPGSTGIIMENLKRYSTHEMRLAGLKIDAEQDKASYYHPFGFRKTAKEFQVNGLIMIPMECLVTAGASTNMSGEGEIPRKKMSNQMVTGIIAAAVLGFILVCSLIGVGVYKYGVSGVYKHNNYYDSDTWSDVPQGDPNDDDYSYGGNAQETEPSDEDAQGIQGIKDYQAENLSYSFEEASFNERSAKGKYQMDFLVKYPKLNGLSENVADTINKTLEDTAMKTVNDVYLNPTDEMKEALLKENVAYLVSYVEYKVTYASEDFLSVVLEDRYYKGDISQEYCSLRSVNINVKTGEVYKVKDIVNLSDDYITDWKNGVKEEGLEITAFDKLSNEDCKKILEGDSLNGAFEETFFVAEDGMQIGASYCSDKGNKKFGWVTVPYGMNEIEVYKTESSFWNLIK